MTNNSMMQLVINHRELMSQGNVINFLPPLNGVRPQCINMIEQMYGFPILKTHDIFFELIGKHNSQHKYELVILEIFETHFTCSDS